MGTEKPHGDVAPGRRLPGKKLRDLVVKRNLSFFDQDHYRSRGELLTDRPGLKNRFRFHSNLMFDVGEAIALEDVDPAVTNNRERESGNFLFAHLGADQAVDSRLNALLRRRGQSTEKHTNRRS